MSVLWAFEAMKYEIIVRGDFFVCLLKGLRMVIWIGVPEGKTKAATVLKL